MGTAAGLQTETGVEVGERGVEEEPPQHEARKKV